MRDAGGAVAVVEGAGRVRDVDPVESRGGGGDKGDETQGRWVTGGVGVGDVETEEFGG